MTKFDKFDAIDLLVQILGRLICGLIGAGLGSLAAILVAGTDASWTMHLVFAGLAGAAATIFGVRVLRALFHLLSWA